MEAIKLCRLDTPIIFIEARINLSRFVVTGCAAKTSATVTFRSEERFSRNAETDLVCRLLLEKKKSHGGSTGLQTGEKTKGLRLFSRKCECAGSRTATARDVRPLWQFAQSQYRPSP